MTPITRASSPGRSSSRTHSTSVVVAAAPCPRSTSKAPLGHRPPRSARCHSRRCPTRCSRARSRRPPRTRPARGANAPACFPENTLTCMTLIARRPLPHRRTPRPTGRPPSCLDRLFRHARHDGLLPRRAREVQRRGKRAQQHHVAGLGRPRLARQLRGGNEQRPQGRQAARGRLRAWRPRRRPRARGRWSRRPPANARHASRRRRCAAPRWSRRTPPRRHSPGRTPWSARRSRSAPPWSPRRPRWAMPWISDTLTPCPEPSAARASRSAASTVPCPPTPHRSTVVASLMGTPFRLCRICVGVAAAFRRRSTKVSEGFPGARD